MLITVEGIYNEGKVELKEQPRLDSPARVIVTFLDASASAANTASGEGRERALQRMKTGLDLGGPPYPSRELLHDRISR